MSEALKLISVCNRSGVALLDQPQLIYILTEILPGESISGTRLPLNFALVLDRSGSMAGEKLRTMRDAVKNIIDQLEEDDLVSIVAFETRAQALIRSQPARDKETLKNEVGSIKAGGGTNMATALREGLELVGQGANEERVSRIVLLTDGEATDNENDSRKLADAAGAQGIPIIGLGFGRDWNEEFLFDLADRSVLAKPGSHAGRADYIPKPQDANNIFQEVYQSMQVVAQDVTVTIRMVQGLETRRVWQVAPLIKDLGHTPVQGRAIQIQVGQLERKGAAFLAEIMLPPRPEGAVRIAQTDVTYTLPEAGPQRQAVDLIVNFSTDAQVYNSVNGHVMNILEKVQAFKLQTQALSEADIGNVASATRKLRQAVTILLSQGETELANQMQEEADHLEQSGQLSSEGKKTIKLTSRKTVKLNE
jgi:Ca-activated chloride channel family protein